MEQNTSIMSRTKTQRRSKRIQRKIEQRELCDYMMDSPLGYFSVLPKEVIFSIFSTLSTTDLSFLTLVSKSLRDLVMEYNLTKQGLMQIMISSCPRNLRNRHKKKTVDLCHCFKDLGLLVKRSTCLYPTKERLRLMEALFKGLTENVELESARINYCYGQFLSIFVKGWEEKECERAYFAINDHQHLMVKIANMLCGKPGAKPDMELDLRSFLRGVLLDQCDSLDDLAMWLHFILKPYPMVHQARLLMILYGPLSRSKDQCDSLDDLAMRLHFILKSCPMVHQARLLMILFGPLSRSKDQIDWTFMTADDEPIVTPLSSAPFKDLAVAIKALLRHREWNTDSVISVLEELTACPSDWQTENIARLLVMSGVGVCVPVLASKAINGKTAQLSAIVVALALVTYLSNLNMSWLINVLRDICILVPNEHDIVAVIDAIVEHFRQYITSMPQHAEMEPMMMFEDVVDAYGCFTKELMMASLLPSSKNLPRHFRNEE